MENFSKNYENYNLVISNHVNPLMLFFNNLVAMTMSSWNQGCPWDVPTYQEFRSCTLDGKCPTYYPLSPKKAESAAAIVELSNSLKAYIDRMYHGEPVKSIYDEASTCKDIEDTGEEDCGKEAIGITMIASNAGPSFPYVEGLQTLIRKTAEKLTSCSGRTTAH